MRRRTRSAVWRILALGLAIGAFWPPGASAAGEACVSDEPPGYRMTDFRAPVPCTLAGATVVSTEALRRLIEHRSPLLIDVLPSPSTAGGAIR